MPLPLKAVDRLFERLLATYGRDFAARYEGLELVAVKTIWAHELSWFADRLAKVAWALENLPERAPNAIEFRNLCRQAPTPEAPPLPEPKADPERVQVELAKLSEIKPALSSVQGANKDWARRILQRHTDGYRVRPMTLRFAREALRINTGSEARGAP